MTRARAVQLGIELAFADGRTGLIPFPDLPEIGTLANLAAIELPNPYAVILRNARGQTVELPWDFARHYCDASYQPAWKPSPRREGSPSAVGSGNSARPLE